MAIDLDARVRLLLERGATQREIRLALEDIDRKAQVNTRRVHVHDQANLVGHNDDLEIMKRAGRLLHFFHYGYPGGNATEADRALCELIKKASS